VACMPIHGIPLWPHTHEIPLWLHTHGILLCGQAAEGYDLFLGVLPCHGSNSSSSSSSDGGGGSCSAAATADPAAPMAAGTFTSAPPESADECDLRRVADDGWRTGGWHPSGVSSGFSEVEVDAAPRVVIAPLELGSKCLQFTCFVYPAFDNPQCTPTTHLTPDTRPPTMKRTHPPRNSQFHAHPQ
jgi:hypothetical protein